MIKGKIGRVYYSVYSLATGKRVTGDAANHTVKYAKSADTTQTWITLPVTVAELGTSGVYTFELPASYTNTDTAVCLVESTDTGVIVPMIELSFYDFSTTQIDVNSWGNLVDALLDTTLPVSTVSGSVGEALETVNTLYTNSIQPFAKILAYPSASVVNSALTTSITPESVANAVLSMDVCTITEPAEYSLTTMVLGGMCSTMDAETNTWSIKQPQEDGTVRELARRRFETSDTMKPIVRVY